MAKFVEVLLAACWLRFDDDILIWYSLLPGMLFARLTAIRDCEISLLVVEICIWLVKAVAGYGMPFPLVFRVIREDLV